MLVGCGYKDELTSIDSTNVLVANFEATILATMATLVAGFTPLNYPL